MIQLDLPMPKHCGMCPCYDPHLRDCRAIMFIDREVNNAIGREPLFGHRSGKKSGTHWMVFMKIPKEE